MKDSQPKDHHYRSSIQGEEEVEPPLITSDSEFNEAINQLSLDPNDHQI
jgi:hypothetical protein